MTWTYPVAGDHAEWAQLFTPSYVPWLYTSVCVVLLCNGDTCNYSINVYEEDSLTGQPMEHPIASFNFTILTTYDTDNMWIYSNISFAVIKPRIFIAVESFSELLSIGTLVDFQCVATESLSSQVSSSLYQSSPEGSSASATCAYKVETIVDDAGTVLRKVVTQYDSDGRVVSVRDLTSSSTSSGSSGCLPTPALLSSGGPQATIVPLSS
eukprot:m51a1_g2109 hypothetical protein (210) ;mRNA; f:1621882-1624312